jgi:hypothetical protein
MKSDRSATNSEKILKGETVATVMREEEKLNKEEEK